ncbi:MAG: 6-bladed beta-propeller, partial [Acidobacteriota bacterium]
MRICFVKVVLILLLFTGFLQADSKFIHNQNSQVLKKEARVLKIKKLISLEGDSDDYQFKNPAAFDIADDGTIFVIDWNRALYRFSRDGHFVANVLKKGEGPGELKYLYKYILLDDRIIMFCHFPNKIVEIGFKGEMLREYKIPNGGVVLLHGVDKNVFFFSLRELSDFQKNLTKEFRDFS